ncbi:MAG: Rpn family recombination-promoting nuclease/putative transposase, partial [Planctomycetes bacterium]|nr:Rpn family recombination-promoting nuclease/putative transposase [Planctomycetota bacterium]
MPLHARYRPRDGSAARDVWINLLLEYQSNPDPLLPFRLLYYRVHLWESGRREQAERDVPEGRQRLSPMLPIVVYTGSRPWERLGSLAELCDVPRELAGFLPRYDSVFFNVGTAPVERLQAGGDPIGEVLRLFRDETLPASPF